MIRKATATDFQFFYYLYMHPSINPWLLYEAMDEAAFALIWKQLLQTEVLYVFENDGEAIGMFKLVPLQHRTSHIAYLGGVAIHPAYLGKGFGKKMLGEILALGRKMGFLRIELSTATNNQKAIALYEQIGFVQEGVLRKFSYLASEGIFLDEVMMGYLYS